MTEKIDKDEINLLELISIIWSERKLLFISFFSVFFLSFFLTFLITPKYESSAILLERSSNSSEISSGASSLARIAGFQLPETNEMSKSALAIELLESFDFFYENLFNDSEFLNNITFDDLNIDPKKAHQFFKDNFKVEENSKSDVLVFSFSSYSPASSRNILDLVISKLNSSMLKREMAESSSSIEFLQEKLTMTNYPEVKTAIADLIKDHTRRLMLSSINDQFVFEILDSPKVPLKKSYPSRIFIALLSSLTFSFLLVGFLLILHFSSKRLEFSLYPLRLKVNDIGQET
tara:strand:- start:15582 stop:16454 length:873 start_codon:yes stop_codon:yes gene_type:complete